MIPVQPGLGLEEAPGRPRACGFAAGRRSSAVGEYPYAGCAGGLVIGWVTGLSVPEVSATGLLRVMSEAEASRHWQCGCRHRPGAGRGRPT